THFRYIAHLKHLLCALLSHSRHILFTVPSRRNMATTPTIPSRSFGYTLRLLYCNRYVRRLKVDITSKCLLYRERRSYALPSRSLLTAYI
ncbi:hypothetical protein M433DRAFT_160064, partial [Acidomyces richmondensis BFW]